MMDDELFDCEECKFACYGDERGAVYRCPKCGSRMKLREREHWTTELARAAGHD